MDSDETIKITKVCAYDENDDLVNEYVLEEPAVLVPGDLLEMEWTIKYEEEP
jgi:hypothetical protein